jgi:hypothetical protein
MRPERDRPPDLGFLADLRTSARVLRDRPLLPLLSVAIWTIPALIPPAFTPVTLPVSLFAIGYPGTERLWFLRGLRGEDLTWSDVWHHTLHYFVRFLLLGLIIVPGGIVGAVAGGLIGWSLVGAFVGLVVASLLLDFGLTFVTPSLALMTARVPEALRTGLRMLKTEWPRNALYVLVPPLAVLLIIRLGPSIDVVRDVDRQLRASMHGRPLRPVHVPYRPLAAGVAAAAALLGLWFKGATVAFFVRRVDVRPYGAALPAPPRPDAPPGPRPIAPPAPTGLAATG